MEYAGYLWSKQQEVPGSSGLAEVWRGFEIQNYESFEGLMNSMMNDEAFLKQAGDKAGAFVSSLSGATDKVLSKVQL